jgi:hypothetical protein
MEPFSNLRRIALLLLTVVLLLGAFAPVVLLSRAPTQGRAALATYAQLVVQGRDEADLAALERRFVTATDPDGTRRLSSADELGQCWQLVLPPTGVPRGPSPAPHGACGPR